MNKISKLRRRFLALPCLLIAAVIPALAPRAAWGVILPFGDLSTNRDAATLQAAGGPAVGSPGFLSVGSTSPGFPGSVTYLSNRWIITAAHVVVQDQVTLNGVNYDVEPGSVRAIENGGGNAGTNADLLMYRLVQDPGANVPSIPPSMIATQTPGFFPPSNHVFMIGVGQTALNYDDASTSDTQLYWQVTPTGNPNDPFVYTPVAPPGPANPGPNDRSGFQPGGPLVQRWGDNLVVGTEFISGNGRLTQVFLTRFDDARYTQAPTTDNEAHGSAGDSGGAVFALEDGVWKLAGIMVSNGPRESGQPPGTVKFGDFTFVADLSAYRSQILAIVPEPSSFVLAALAGAGLLLRLRRPRRF